MYQDLRREAKIYYRCIQFQQDPSIIGKLCTPYIIKDSTNKYPRNQSLYNLNIRLSHFHSYLLSLTQQSNLKDNKLHFLT